MHHILVIDDEPSIRKLIHIMLEKNGYEVDEAADGAEGMKKIKADPPDLIITDLIMPGKEGIETIIELRRDYPDVKIIAMSGGGVIGPREYLKMAKSVGAHRTFKKPFEMRELLESVDDLLKQVKIRP